MNSASDAAIDIRNLSVSYGSRQVLGDFNLRVARGIIFGLIGLNGMGKTTLIRAMLNLRPAGQGDIKFFGQDSAAPQARRKVAYLPERFDPPSFLTGHEFLSFTAKLYGMPYDRAQGEIQAGNLDLDSEALGRRIGTYSKGMRQKLGLASNILSGADLQILDEPMSGLDPRARALVKGSLLAMKEQGRTVFFSSHILSDMEEICDRVAILHEGRIMFEGTAPAMIEAGRSANPEKAFLAIIDAAQAA